MDNHRPRGVAHCRYLMSRMRFDRTGGRLSSEPRLSAVHLLMVQRPLCRCPVPGFRRANGRSAVQRVVDLSACHRSASGRFEPVTDHRGGIRQRPFRPLRPMHDRRPHWCLNAGVTLAAIRSKLVLRCAAPSCIPRCTSGAAKCVSCLSGGHDEWRTGTRAPRPRRLARSGFEAPARMRPVR